MRVSNGRSIGDYVLSTDTPEMWFLRARSNWQRLIKIGASVQNDVTWNLPDPSGVRNDFNIWHTARLPHSHQNDQY